MLSSVVFRVLNVVSCTRFLIVIRVFYFFHHEQYSLDRLISIWCVWITRYAVGAGKQQFCSFCNCYNVRSNIDASVGWGILLTFKEHSFEMISRLKKIMLITNGKTIFTISAHFFVSTLIVTYNDRQSQLLLLTALMQP